MVLGVLTRFFKRDESLFSFNLKYLYLLGLWPTDDMSQRQRIFYKIYEIFLSLLSFMFILTTGIGTYQSKDDSILLLSNLDKSVVSYNYFLKMLVFSVKRNELKCLIRDIQRSGDFVSEYRKNLMVKLVVFVTSMPLIVVVAFTGFGVIRGEMSVEAWMPFDSLKSRKSLIIACQILAIFFTPCSCRGSAMQGLICSLIMYLCDQLKSLQDDVKNLKYSEELGMEMRGRLKSIVKKHIRLIRYTKSIENMFKVYFLIQHLAILMEICLTAVMVASVEVKQMTLLITFISYLIAVLVNGYIYCYLGNDLIIQSQALAAAAYEAPWSSWPVDMQKTLLTLITVAQRPLKLTACGIVRLSVETFAQALYNGYSIFAVLKDVVN